MARCSQASMRSRGCPLQMGLTGRSSKDPCPTASPLALGTYRAQNGLP